MPSIIYADNFRGFQNSIVEFEDVSFLVGENSSGKSSLLSLSHLLQGSAFWVNPDFNAHGHEFGGFSDIASQAKGRLQEFTVGFCKPRHVDDGGGVVSGFLSVITFRSEKGRAVPHKCTYLHGKDVITFEEIPVGFRYRVQSEIGSGLQPEAARSTFERVISLHKAFSRTNSKIIKQARKPPRNVMLFSVPYLIDNARRGSASSAESSEGFFIPDEFFDGVWFAPIRTRPQRVYHSTANAEYSPDGAHTPYLLRDRLTRRGKSLKTTSQYFQRFGSASGLFEDLKIHTFGREDSAPFEITVSVGGHSFSLGNVGYGVSQILPILVELVSRGPGTPFFVQQPEVHLHPRAQAALGNVFYASAVGNGAKFVIETHSDFMIDRFRSLCRRDIEPDLKKPTAAIYWFSNSSGENTVHKIPISDDGSLGSDQPEGYRNFFVNESLANLSL